MPESSKCWTTNLFRLFIVNPFEYDNLLGEKQIKERPEIPGNITHSEYFNKLLKERVNLSPIPKISSLNAVMQFEITDNGNGTWNIIVENGLVRDVTAELCVPPTCIFKLNSATFLSIIKREITPQQAFFLGMVDIKGDILLALKMNILVTYM